MAEELARKETLLRELVIHIAGRTGMLLELVNYNVEGASAFKLSTAELWHSS